jgi:hypothetical protein
VQLGANFFTFLRVQLRVKKRNLAQQGVIKSPYGDAILKILKFSVVAYTKLFQLIYLLKYL